MRKLIAGVVLACAGFIAGAWWHALLMVEPPPGPGVAPIALPNAACPAPAAAREPAAGPPAAMPAPVGGAACAELFTALDATTRELNAERLDWVKREELRAAKEGTPVPAPAAAPEPRFQPEKLRSAISDAFVQSGVPGRVDGLDCTEWPCIVYGRIRGTEDEMEKIEGAKTLAAYQRDILTVLLWVVTDEAANEAPLPVLPGRPEQALFAMAFYPRGLERGVSENVDRRLRTRTAELWNTMSPQDQTGR